MTSIVLPIVRANATFNNTHNTMINNDIMEVVVHATMYAVKFENVEIANLASEILISLVATQNSPAVHTCNDVDFQTAIENLSAVNDKIVMRRVVRTITIKAALLNFRDMQPNRRSLV